MRGITLRVEVDVWYVLRGEEIRGMLTEWGVENTPYENGSATDGLTGSSLYGGRGFGLFCVLATVGSLGTFPGHRISRGARLGCIDVLRFVPVAFDYGMPTRLHVGVQTGHARLPLSSVCPGAHPSFFSWLPTFTYRIVGGRAGRDVHRSGRCLGFCSCVRVYSCAPRPILGPVCASKSSALCRASSPVSFSLSEPPPTFLFFSCPRRGTGWVWTLEIESSPCASVVRASIALQSHLAPRLTDEGGRNKGRH
jgi:hypothetical protein